MSLVQRFLGQLEKRGLAVEYKDESTLLLVGPAAEKTPEVLAACKAYKAELLKLLAPRVAAAATEADRPANVVRPAPPGWPPGLPAHCGHCGADAVLPGGSLCEPAACPLKGRDTDDPPPQS
jgi:hypothetical protein